MHVDFKTAGFIRDIGQPAAIGRKLRPSFVEPRFQEGLGFPVIQPQHPDGRGLSLGLGLDERQQAPIGRKRKRSICVLADREPLQSAATVRQLPEKIPGGASPVGLKDHPLSIRRPDRDVVCVSFERKAC